MDFFKRNLIDFNIFTLFQYLFIILILIYMYEGGNVLDHHACVYAFDLNYLSDLGRKYFFDGSPNPFWFFYSLSIFLIGIGVFLFFYLLGFLIKNKFKRQILIFFGLLSGIGYALIGVFPIDTSFNGHILAGMLASYSFLIAIFLLIFFIDKKEYPVIFYVAILLSFLLLFRLGLYYTLKYSELGSGALLRIKIIYQKILVYTQILLAIYILLQIKKYKIRLYSQ